MSAPERHEPCGHPWGHDWNCTKCILARQEARGKRDEDGVLHSDNGAGYCVGHVVHDRPGDDGRCVLLIQHCPVLNTPEQLAENLHDDALARWAKVEQRVRQARQELRDAEDELAEAKAAL